jgi:dTDP-4-dehydrorhamnose 3,5-epimerase
MSFQFTSTKIQGMVLVQPLRHGDHRGFFEEIYKRSAFRSGGIEAEFVQDNVARSARGVLRGLHFQLPPAPQGKLVRVMRGEIFDVGVDLRKGSPTFGQWEGVVLNDSQGALLYLPPGLAHGYCVLSETADLAYKVTAEFDAELDSGIRWDDPQIGVDWPIREPILSEKDRTQPTLAELDSPFLFQG